MPVHDHVAFREPGQQPRVTPWARSPIVNQADAGVADVDHEALRQRGLQRRLVGVSENSLDGSKPLKLRKRRGSLDVTGVENDVGSTQRVQTLVRESTCTARQMRVGNECGSDQALVLTPERRP